MKELNEHEIEVATKIDALFDMFMGDLLDVLDGEELSYTIATLIAIAEEIMEVTKNIKQAHSRKALLEKMVEEIFGKTP